MSISEIGGNDEFSTTLDTVGSPLNTAGLPDAGLLEKFANDYFKQTSGFGSMSETATVLPTTPNLPTASVPALPLNSVPATTVSQPLSNVAPPSLLGALTPAQLESIASSTAAPAVDPRSFTSLNAPTTFGFLSSIRPLASAPAAPLPTPLPSLKLPTETFALPFDSTLPGTIPSIPQPANDVTSPLSIGATPQAKEHAAPFSYSFVRDARPLTSFDAIPQLEPFDYVPDADSSLSTLSSAPFDVNAVRRDFPILEERINGRQLVWLDNAATTQKPQSVIDRISYYYEHESSNIHRAAHTLAARSTDAYEGARDKVAKFLNASSSKDIIFVRGATEGINLLAQTWGDKYIQQGDEILITWLEHHANIVPWQMLCAKKGARLKVAPVDSDGQVVLEEYEKLLGPKTKLVSVTQVSNALGTVTPVKEMVDAAHRYGAKAIVDGAQAVSHMPIDVQAIDCDFYVFSGHKVFAPTGIGVVYGKQDVLQHMPPWQGGGNMIVDVTFEKTTYHGPPGRFEAGTGAIAPAVGLGAAIDYLNKLGMHNVARYEHDLLVYATAALSEIPGLHLIGTAKEKASVLSFVLDGFRTEEVGTALNQEGIAVRSGHHCAQPILRRFGLESTVRPSLALYNTCEEVDKLVSAIWNIKQGRPVSVV